MASVTIDAGVLALPAAGASAADVERFVDSLLDWWRLREEAWVAVYLSEWAYDALSSDGHFPARPTLDNLFRATDTDQGTAKLVHDVIADLLRRTPTFEERFHVQDVLPEDPDSLPPGLLLLHRSPVLSECLQRVSFLLAILRTYCPEEMLNHALVVRQWSEAREVALWAQLHEVTHSRNELNVLPVPPDSFHGSVLVCPTFHDFLLSLDPVPLWQTADDAGGLELAVRLAWYQARVEKNRASRPDWDAPVPFRFGAHFYERAADTGILRNRGLADSALRATVYTLMRLLKGKPEHLRTGMAGNSPQRRIGRAGAWRRDIAEEHHLHYWQWPGGCCEFAWISFPHDDFYIAQPGPDDWASRQTEVLEETGEG